MDITIIEGDDLTILAHYLGLDVSGTYRIRVSQSDNGIKVKVNEGIWSPALGRKEN